MSVRVTVTVPNLNTREYFSTKRQVQAIESNTTLGSECCFLFPNCDWYLPAFADLTDIDTYKNDLKDFIIKVADNTTVVGTLIKIAPDGTETSTTIVDNTYGIFSPLGSLKANVWGFLLDWRLVASGLGFGRYKFNISVSNSTPTEIFNQDSVCFQLMPYSCENAHRTVRIETKQSGYFEGGFDYTGMVVPIGNTGQNFRSGKWTQQLRLWGRFFREGRDLNIDNVVTEDRGQEMIQTQTIKRYLLKLDTVKAGISNHVIDDMLLAPEVRISDYNINNIEVYKSERVTLTGLNDPTITPLNINEFYDINFAEWKQNNVHRFK